MNKLKTLEDIRKEWDNEKFTFDGQNCAREGMLREEAIKWIKLCEHEKKRAFNSIDSLIIEGQIRWIKHFFNLTEDDLK